MVPQTLMSLLSLSSVDHGSGSKDTELTILLYRHHWPGDWRDTQASDIKIYDGKDPEILVTGSISVDEDGLLGWSASWSRR